jgi:hypothetical protein
MRNPRVFWIVLLLFAGCGSSSPPAEKAAASPRPAKILHFYASPGEVEPGAEALVCYGVEDSVSVRIDPEIEKLKPLNNRCFPVALTSTTKFELIAQGAGGDEKRESFTIRVGQAKAPQAAGLIESFLASPPKVSAGQPVNLCYSAPQAESVRIEPDLGLPLPEKKGCALARPAKTTVYRLIAQGGGQRDQEQVTVEVQ